MFACLLLVVLTGIYLLVEHNRSVSFFNKLDERARIAGQFYFGEDDLSIQMFNKATENFPRSLSKEKISIYDENMHPKFMPDDTTAWGKDILLKVLENKSINFNQEKSQVSGLYYEDNSGNFIVMVSAVDERGFDDMEQLRIIMTAFYFVSLFITFFIGRIFANISLQPIVKISSDLKNIRASNLHERLTINNVKIDEIDVLSLTINQLLEHLQQSFDNQRSFVSNASHELRTPITSILGVAEITLLKERTSSQYQAALKEIVIGAGRLNSIINSLMELMQTNLNNEDFQNIRIDELMWEILDELNFKEQSDNLQISYNLPDNPSKKMLSGNRRLLFIAVSNLLKNALKFSCGNPVKCEVSYKNHGLQILIVDNGIGISKEDLKNIFQPFYRAKNAIKFSGYGIGLSLTYNIVRLHNGDIEINSKINEGTSVKLFFPTVGLINKI